MRATPRVHARVTRNNTPGMLPKASERASSEGGSIEKNSDLLATLEGEKLEPTEVAKSSWYDQPREKRVCVTKDKAKPVRR